MKTFMIAMAFAATVFVPATHAADAASAANAASAAPKQQTKMGACSADFKATGKPGAERQAFMAECLKKDSGAKKPQQDKMKTCNADATGKTGDERKAFMKECLSK